MADNAPTPFKPRVGKTETSRLKTETARLARPGSPVDPSAERTVAMPPPAPPAAEPAGPPITDPMAIREKTSTGTLRRVQSPEETATALAPAGAGAGPKRSETVRLKVVRNTRSELQNVVPEGQAATTKPAGQTVAVPPPDAEAHEAPRPEVVTSQKKGTATLKVGTAVAAPAGPVPVADQKKGTATLKVGPTLPAGAAPVPVADQKHGTATLKLQPGGRPTAPTTSAADLKRGTATLKRAPAAAAEPSQAGGVSEPDTSTIKLQIKKPTMPPVPGGSLDADASKSATATLKIRPPGPAAVPAAPPPPPGTAPDVSRQVTATLKARTGAAPAAAETGSGATIKITPPPIAAAATAAEAAAGRASLRLRREPEAKPAERVPALPPGLGERPPATEPAAPPAEPEPPAAQDAEPPAAATVAVPPVEAEIPKKKGLRLKAGKEKAGDEAAAPEAAPETKARPEARQMAVVSRPAVGPSGLAGVAASVACVGALALLVQLLLDFKRYL